MDEPVALLGVGGVAYTAGAIIYARRRPNPLLAVFGYHELFHALTLVAVACQYVAIAFFVIRSARRVLGCMTGQARPHSHAK